MALQEHVVEVIEQHVLSGDGGLEQARPTLINHTATSYNIFTSSLPQWWDAAAQRIAAKIFIALTSTLELKDIEELLLCRYDILTGTKIPTDMEGDLRVNRCSWKGKCGFGEDVSMLEVQHAHTVIFSTSRASKLICSSSSSSPGVNVQAMRRLSSAFLACLLLGKKITYERSIMRPMINSWPIARMREGINTFAFRCEQLWSSKMD